MDSRIGNTLDREVEKASYKKDFFKTIYSEKSAKLQPIWNTGDQA